MRPVLNNNGYRVPPNVKFEVDDAESPWTHTAPFDFIFCRYLLGGIADWPALMGNIYEYVSLLPPLPYPV